MSAAAVAVDVGVAFQAGIALLQLVQQAMANGDSTIPLASYQDTVMPRNTALAQLDADIAAERSAEQTSSAPTPAAAPAERPPGS